MTPRKSISLAVLALFLGGTAALAQQDHSGHEHAQPMKPSVTPIAKPAVKQAGSGLPADTGGKLEVESRTFDVGSVERGGKITHSFTLKNTGTGPLHVDAKPG